MEEQHQGRPNSGAVVLLGDRDGRLLSGAYARLGESFRVIAAAGAPHERSAVGDALAEAAVESASIVAVSSTARLALWHALEHPETVDLLVLASPCGVLSGDLLASATDDVEALIQTEADGERLAGPVSEAYAELVRDAIAAPDPELEGLLGRIDIPTLVAVGSADRVVSPDAGRVYVERMPRAYHAVVYGAGHAAAHQRERSWLTLVGDFVGRGEAFAVQHRSHLLAA